MNQKGMGDGSAPKEDAVPMMHKMGLSSEIELKEVNDQNFKHVPTKCDAKDDSLSTREDRVQGLSGNHLTSSEDDLLFEEGQASQTDKQKGSMGLNPECGSQKQTKKGVKSPIKEWTVSNPKMGSARKKSLEYVVEERSLEYSEFDQASDGVVINIIEA
jgi:hypothetical protein